MSSVTLTAEELAGVMQNAIERFVERIEGREKSEDSKPFIPSTVWASQFSNCARQLTLRMTKGHELPPFKPETLARFRRGKDRARNVKADLEQAGRDSTPPFELVGAEERFVLQWDGIDVISGKVDWKTKFGLRQRAIPTEYKSWSPMLTDRVNTFEDLFSNRWTRKGAYQLLCYMWGSSSEWGLFVLDRPGLPKFLPVNLFANDCANLQRVEHFLRTATEAVKKKNLGELPDFIKDPEECKSCDFLGGHCTPPFITTGAGLEFVSDQELAVALDRRGELQPAHKEYEILDKSVKAALRGKELAVVGDWLINGKWQKSTTTEIPPDQKALVDSWKRTDPKGKFVLKFFRVGGKAEEEGQGED